MSKIAGLPEIRFKPQVSQVRIKTGSNGGLPFILKIGEQLNVPVKPVTDQLERIAARLAQSPFYDRIKAKPVTVCLVPESDILPYLPAAPAGLASRYSAPEVFARGFPCGIYVPVLDAVLINSKSRFKTNDEEILFHELLHAYSLNRLFFEAEKLAGNQSGIMVVTPGKITAAYLNEGLTEYLRVRAGGPGAPGCYKAAYEVIALLAGRIGETALFDAYFDGDIEGLTAAVDRHYGSGAWHIIKTYAQGDSSDHELDKARDFARYGFESLAMKYWGYSAENRTRAPRRLLYSELPAELAQIFRGLDLSVYTNLTLPELRKLFSRVSREEFHSPALGGFSYAAYLKLAAMLENEKRLGRELTLINLEPDSNRQSARITSAALKAEARNTQGFLGKIEPGSQLCRVYLD